MLSAVLSQIGKWLLAQLAAFLAKWGRKQIATLEEKKKEDAAVKELKDAKTLEEKEKAELSLLNN